jgi:hypothetical protein
MFVIPRYWHFTESMLCKQVAELSCDVDATRIGLVMDIPPL